jgi:2,4-dichlorophenol 6-monooxygenase
MCKCPDADDGQQAIGEHVPYEILSKTHWATNPKVADGYRSPINPEVYLVGDAAHAFPPTGGLGVNTGIADAHNLAWKIHAVEQQWAGPAFLDTYTAERQPIAIANAHQSALNQKKLYQLMRLTSDPSLRTEISALGNSATASCISSAIDANADHFDSINLQIGYQYGVAPPMAGRCDKYTARGSPGVRLPHAWIKRHGGQCSTLDLISSNSFTILAHEDFGHAGLGHVKVGPALVPVGVLHVDKEFVDEEGTWSALMQIDSNGGGGVLVRPDQHIVRRVGSWQDVTVALEQFFNCRGDGT